MELQAVVKPRLLNLPHGHVCVIDEEDWVLVKDKTLYRGSNGYVYYSTWEANRSVPRTLHSLLIGTIPGKHADHINGDKVDNRRENLRLVSPSLNQVNRKRPNQNNRSGVRGVSLSQGGPKWRAQIMVERKAIHLGLFDTKEEAIKVRRAAELTHYGEICP